MLCWRLTVADVPVEPPLAGVAPQQVRDPSHVPAHLRQREGAQRRRRGRRGRQLRRGRGRGVRRGVQLQGRHRERGAANFSVAFHCYSSIFFVNLKTNFCQYVSKVCVASRLYLRSTKSSGTMLKWEICVVLGLYTGPRTPATGRQAESREVLSTTSSEDSYLRPPPNILLSVGYHKISRLYVKDIILRKYYSGNAVSWNLIDGGRDGGWGEGEVQCVILIPGPGLVCNYHAQRTDAITITSSPTSSTLSSRHSDARSQVR